MKRKTWWQRTTKLNKYTLVMDVLFENPDNSRFEALVQIDDPQNRDDANLFTSWKDGARGIGVQQTGEGSKKQPRPITLQAFARMFYGGTFSLPQLLRTGMVTSL